MTAVSTRRVFRADPRVLDQREHHHRASFSACHTESCVLVTVEGEVDMTNSRILAGYVERQVSGSARLVLDLRLVDFFGTAGFAALHNVNVICSRSGITWELKAGRQVRRLLGICDRDGVLPLERSPSLLDDVRAGARDGELLVGRNH